MFFVSGQLTPRMQSIQLQCSSLLDMSYDAKLLPSYTHLIAQPVTARPDWKLHTLPRYGAHERNIFWKGGRDSAYLVPTKVFLQPVAADAMYFSLCAKAHSPPSIIPFLLAQDLYPQHIMPGDIRHDDDLLINEVKINMHLSVWVRVLIVEGYHLQQWMVSWCIPPLKHWTETANTTKQMPDNYFLFYFWQPQLNSQWVV